MQRHHDTPGSITDVTGIEVGHHTDTRRPTGCTVVLCEHGVVCGVDVRGGDTLHIGFTPAGQEFNDVTLTGPADFVFEGQARI